MGKKSRRERTENSKRYTPPAYRCTACHRGYENLSDLYTCEHCYTPLYCNRACQETHWCFHRVVCGVLAFQRLKIAIETNDLELVRKLVVTEDNINRLGAINDLDEDEISFLTREKQKLEFLATPIFQCVKYNNARATEILLKTGKVDLGFVSQKTLFSKYFLGATCIVYASAKPDRHEIIDLLLTHGASPDDVDHHGKSCLQLAIKAMSYGNIECLVEAGVAYRHKRKRSIANLKKKWYKSDAYRENMARINDLLDQHSQHKCLVCQDIIKSVANVFTCAACYFPRYCSYECQKLRWNYHKVVCGGYATSQMQKAIRDNDLELLEKLVATKKNVNLLWQDAGEELSLLPMTFFCVRENRPAALRILLETGQVDIEWVGKTETFGCTCLAYASSLTGTHKCIKLLLNHGANRNAINQTDIALDCDNIKCLLDAGVNFNDASFDAVENACLMKLQDDTSDVDDRIHSRDFE